MIPLAPSRRVRRTPWTDRLEAAGLSSLTVYNRMRLPVSFRGAAEDCRHLKSAVQVWDVACERQVEVRGPDATALVQRLTPRDLSELKYGRLAYIPVCNGHGRMLNDPVALQVDEDRWWISIGDSDLRLWVEGLAIGLGADVEVSEPDINPLAIQGPRADELAARVFGDLSDLKFYNWRQVPFDGHLLVCSRSGFSKQGGFEVFCNTETATGVWDALMEAGRDLDVRAGGPNLIERIEGGLLSYGNDMDHTTTPFEAGLGKFCGGEHDHIGKCALEAARDPIRIIRAIEIEADALPPCDSLWTVHVESRPVGHVSSAAFAPDRGCGVAIGMVETALSGPVTVEAPDGPRPATVREKFWL